jgi:signal peptidase I
LSERKIIEDAAPSEAGGGLWELVKVLLQAFVIAVVARTLLFQPFDIPSGSMIPTLLIGDYLFVSKYSYGYSHYSLPGFLDFAPRALPGRILFSSPQRGDVVVFRPPGDLGEAFIKRVIGLPGDTIQMIKGRLNINGVEVPREPAEPYAMLDAFRKPARFSRYWETLPGGARHEIVQIDGDDGEWSNTRVYTVPAGDYFMMGDNRDNSTDSRVMPGPVGFVPAENLIGRAEILFFSIDDAPAWQFWRWPWTARWNRLFRRIH